MFGWLEQSAGMLCALGFSAMGWQDEGQSGFKRRNKNKLWERLEVEWNVDERKKDPREKRSVGREK